VSLPLEALAAADAGETLFCTSGFLFFAGTGV
jgi:hypothetical protein